MWKCSFLAALSLAFIACGPGEVLEVQEQKLESVRQPVVQAGVQTVGPLKVARTGHCSARLLDGRVLFVGGYISDNREVTAATEVYDPGLRTTSLRAPMNVARGYPMCLRLQDGSVLALGGNLANGYGSRVVERYDPSSNTWTLLPSMPDIGLTAVIQLDDGRVLATGASSSDPNAYLFDPTSNVWTRTGSLNVGRYCPAPIKLPDGRVLMVGGLWDGRGQPDNQRTLEVYTPSTGTWSLLAPLLLDSTHPAAALLPDGRVFVGEMDDTSTNLYPQVYDPKTDTWAILKQANSLHNVNTRVVLVDDQPIVVGGSLSYTQTPIERYDVALQQWSTLGQLGIPRDQFTMDVLPDGSILVAGGSPINSLQPYDTVELITVYDGPPRFYYSASTTNNALQNTTTRTFTLRTGDLVEVGTTEVPGSSASGDTYLRLFNRYGPVASNDDSFGTLASYIRYSVRLGGTYEVRAGCYANTSCGGTVAIRVTPANQ